jgi:hypothetical protein
MTPQAGRWRVRPYGWFHLWYPTYVAEEAFVERPESGVTIVRRQVAQFV